MSNSANLLSRYPRLAHKTITFDGATGSGAVGTVAVFTVTGQVRCNVLSIWCSTDLAGATATVALGVASNTAELIAATTATDIDSGDFWDGTTPNVGAGVNITKNIGANLIITVATAAVSAGVLEFSMRWFPLSANGHVA